MGRVVVVGNGYVGSGMVRMLSRAHDVVVYDIKMGEDRRDVAINADLAVVCVPTPMGPDGACRTDAVEEVVGWLPVQLVVVKSTVPPGTCDRLSYATGKDVHFSPEYMGEPRSFVAPWRHLDPSDPTSHPFCVVGGPRADDVLAFFQACMATDTRFIACAAPEAELAKYMENGYFATKVAFCNEVAGIARALGLSYNRVRDIWTQDPRVEADHTMVFRDRPGFGGKCLPKDLSALIAIAQDVGAPSTLLEAVRAANDEQRQGVAP